MKKLYQSYALVTLLGLAGCAAAPVREAEAPRDAVTSLRATLATMSDDELAPGVRLELERARAWLSEADAAIAKDDEREKVALLVELSRGELVLVKSILERKKAEAALAQKSDDYRRRREALEAVQHDAEVLDPTAGEEP
jgi:predicted negative regulator of RcsB-dependent stress response